MTDPIHKAQDALLHNISEAVERTRKEWSLCYYDVAGVFDAYLKGMWDDICEDDEDE